MTVADALRRACDELRTAGVEGSRLDAEVLLSRALGRGRAWLHGYADRPLDETSGERFREWIGRRCAGEPVAYLTGEREFCSLSFRVGPGVFIPRPETEGLVERSRAFLPAGRPGGVVDACTGSGNVAAALALQAGWDRVAATEIDPIACETARRNFRRLGTDVALFAGDLLAPLGSTPWAEALDLVCANPPYIPTRVLAGLPAEVKREPRRALDGGIDGLETVKRLLVQAFARLREGGGLLVEIGDEQGADAAEAARRAGFVGVRVERDLAGLDRYLIAVRGPAR